MPVGKRKQSSAVFYALLTFVGLFVAATTVAVIYYVRAEKYRTEAARLQTDMSELANPQEWGNRGKIVGTRQSRKTYLGIMVDYLDKTVALVIGGPVEPTSAEVKVANTVRDVNETIKLVQQDIAEALDPNSTGLASIAQKLKAKLDSTMNEKAAVAKEYQDLKSTFDVAIQEQKKREQDLLAEKDKYHQQVLDITGKYDDLKSLMEKTADERAQTLMAQLQQERDNLKNTNDQLLKTNAELAMTQDRMRRALEELEKVKPPPQREALAYQPDGKVVLVDEQAGVVHLSIGSASRVYRGLTFSVYDRNAPIPTDGKGKAEIEVFNLERNVSAARIVRSEKKNPIARDDIVANLIWGSDKANVFVVVGDFDLEGDGNINFDAISKIRTLIEKWGGSVADNVSAQTDFVVLGQAPLVPKEPTVADLELDPTAKEKHQAAVQRLNHYKEVQSRAEALRIPIFKYDRFLDFIGYSEQANKPGAF
jgi:regulator of replication initiation timing